VISVLIRPIRLRCGDQAEPGRRATWLELFFDLAFVAAVAQVGTPLEPSTRRPAWCATASCSS
jgi:low temperature requirement protein LtrA